MISGGPFQQHQFCGSMINVLKVNNGYFVPKDGSKRSCSQAVNKAGHFQVSQMPKTSGLSLDPRHVVPSLSHSVFHGPLGGLNCLSYCCLFPSWYFHRHFKLSPHSHGRLHQSKPDVLHICQLSFGVKYCSVSSSVFSAYHLALLWCNLSLNGFLLSQKVHQLPS